MSQQEYIKILFADCGFSAADRAAWLSREYGCSTPYAMSFAQRHEAIERLKQLKAAQGEAAQARAGEEESGLLPF